MMCRGRANLRHAAAAVDERKTLIIDDGPWCVVSDQKADARRLLSAMYDVGT